MAKEGTVVFKLNSGSRIQGSTLEIQDCQFLKLARKVRREIMEQEGDKGFKEETQQKARDSAKEQKICKFKDPNQ